MSLQNRINFYEMTFKADTDGRLGTKSIIFVEDYLYSYNFIFSLYFLLLLTWHSPNIQVPPVKCCVVVDRLIYIKKILQKHKIK